MFDGSSIRDKLSNANRINSLVAYTGAFPIAAALAAGAKAWRMGEEMFARVSAMLRQSQLPPFDLVRCDVIGGDGDGPTTVGLMEAILIARA